MLYEKITANGCFASFYSGYALSYEYFPFKMIKC